MSGGLFVYFALVASLGAFLAFGYYTKPTAQQQHASTVQLERTKAQY